MIKLMTRYNSSRGRYLELWESRLRQQALKIMNQEKVIKQQVELIYDMRARSKEVYCVCDCGVDLGKEVESPSITLFDPDTNTHSVLKVGGSNSNKRKYKQKEKG